VDLAEVLVELLVEAEAVVLDQAPVVMEVMVGLRLMGYQELQIPVEAVVVLEVLLPE
jgi:hypothetical protein